LFFAEHWKLRPRLQLYTGLRYGIVSAPFEVDRFTAIAFREDANHFSPRFWA